MPITGIGPSITKKTEYNTLIYFFSVIVNVVSLFISVPVIGLVGVAFSLFLGSLSLMILGWYNSEKLYPVGFNKGAMLMNISITLLIIFINYYLDLNIIIRGAILLGLLMVLLLKYYKRIIVLFDN